MAKVRTPGDPASRADEAQAAEFGAALRQTRLAHGRELGEVAKQLRIRQVYLQAMEEGRFDDLPGPTYAIGFVRAYADYLGLDEDEVVKRYKDLRGGLGAPTTLVPPAPVTEGRLPTGSILLLAVVLAAGAYGGWYYLSMKGRDPGEVVTALPDRIAAMVGLKREHVPSPDHATALSPVEPVDPGASPTVSPAPGASIPPDSAPAPAQPDAPASSIGSAPTTIPPGSASTQGTDGAASAPVAAVPPASATAPEAVSAVDQPGQAAGETAPVQPSSSTAVAVPNREAAVVPPAPQSAPAFPVEGAGAPAVPPPPAAQPAAPVAEAATGSRVVLQANASAWVEIRNAEDRRVFSRLMRAGETYSVPPTPGLTLTTGNAGGIAVLVDGKALPPLGRQGDVRRDLALDADTLLRQAGAAP